MSARNLNFRRVFEKYLPPEALKGGESSRRQSLLDQRPVRCDLLQCTFRVSSPFPHFLVRTQKRPPRLVAHWIFDLYGRGERIRTSDLSVPNRAHYQAVLRPEAYLNGREMPRAFYEALLPAVKFGPRYSSNCFRILSAARAR
jgi:hypothetical protein